MTGTVGIFVTDDYADFLTAALPAHSTVSRGWVSVAAALPENRWVRPDLVLLDGLMWDINGVASNFRLKHFGLRCGSLSYLVRPLRPIA